MKSEVKYEQTNRENLVELVDSAGGNYPVFHAVKALYALANAVIIRIVAKLIILSRRKGFI